jgi:tRNA U34 2-thiouridine synthase MnmA/TrmU
MKKSKALALLSGGLDSALAAKLVLEQNIDVIGIKFTSPFCLCDSGGKCRASEVANSLGMPLKIISKGEDYLELVRNPKYGYGSALNPCLDCRIYMLRETKELMKETNADFIITGEVLGQRPMSQYRKAFNLIEQESGLEGKILRPLSAKLLPETEVEREGLVNREKLLSIRGRSRKKQFELVKKFGITGYSTPAGGCLLTQKEFASKLKDLFEHSSKVTWHDIELLKIGRHFRSGNSKIIVGRNEKENKILLSLKYNDDYWFEVPNYGSPIVVLQGGKDELAIKVASAITARYSDCNEDEVLVKYNDSEGKEHTIKVKPAENKLLDSLRIAWE